MRARVLWLMLVMAAGVWPLAGCGTGGRSRTAAHRTPVVQASCPEGPLPHPPSAPGGQPQASLLLPIGNSLAGPPRAGAWLPSASFPYLGIRCHVANWAGCDRVGVGVHLARPAVLVIVQVDGHAASLSPPSDPGSDLWEGVLLGIGPRHGPLAVHVRHGYWYGEPPVRPRVRVTASFADGTTATHAGIGYLHAGYG